jgi:MSHA pilin protein MshA
MRSTVTIVQSKARVSGLQPSPSNPGGSGANQQSDYVIDTPFGSSEVDWANLCPESEAEEADRLTMLDFTTIRAGTGGLQTRTTNRYTYVGYDLPPGGCYVEYDSFGGAGTSRTGGQSPCTISVVTTGCSD